MPQPNQPPRVVIVGGGFAGLAAARALRKARAEVALVDKKNHHLFQPLLYQVATAALSPGTIAAPLRKILERQQNTSVYMGEVHAVDLDAQQVEIGPDRMRYAYDYLVLAAGARTNYFGHDDWERHAPGLKTVDDAIDIRRRFLLAFEQAEFEDDDEARRAALTFVLVGAGPTGVEMAGALAEISRTTLQKSFKHFNSAHARVVLLDAGDRVLEAFDPELSARAQRDLERLGVEVRLGCRVEEVLDGGVCYRHDDTLETIHANNVVWAAGVAAAPIAETLGVERRDDGRVEVGEDLSLPGRPEVFVVGDIAAIPDGAGGWTP
ncbi:MAG: FAD-dependent oxidoreductase, partial [Planctomycetota bacterium]